MRKAVLDKVLIGYDTAIDKLEVWAERAEPGGPLILIRNPEASRSN